jgi:hypothetical protein
MQLFKSYTFTWWQLAIFKTSLLSIGAALGAYFSQLILANLTVIIVIAVLTTTYIIYLALKQV